MHSAGHPRAVPDRPHAERWCLWFSFAVSWYNQARPEERRKPPVNNGLSVATIRVEGFSESYFLHVKVISPGRATAMIISNRGRSNWSKCKRAAATLFILLFAPVLARAQSIGASVKTWREIKAAHEAAEALANPNVTAKERRVWSKSTTNSSGTIRSLSRRKTPLPHFSGKTGRRKQPSIALADSATAPAGEWGSGQLVGRRLPQDGPRPRSGGAVSFGGSLRK